MSEVADRVELVIEISNSAAGERRESTKPTAIPKGGETK
jgi:hypothetical protein